MKKHTQATTVEAAIAAIYNRVSEGQLSEEAAEQIADDIRNDPTLARVILVTTEEL